MSFEKIGGQWILGGGGSNFSNLLAPWASGSRSLMLKVAPEHPPISHDNDTIRKDSDCGGDTYCEAVN